MRISGTKEAIEKANMVIVVEGNEYRIVKNRNGKKESGKIKEVIK